MQKYPFTALAIREARKFSDRNSGGLLIQTERKRFVATVALIIRVIEDALEKAIDHDSIIFAVVSCPEDKFKEGAYNVLSEYLKPRGFEVRETQYRNGQYWEVIEAE